MKRIIGSVLILILTILFFCLSDGYGSDALVVLFTLFSFLLLICVVYWLYISARYSLYPLLFGNFKKLNLFLKIIHITMTAILFPFALFVYLIDYPKYKTLATKLKEKESINCVKVWNSKKDKYETYKEHKFTSEQTYAIFGIEFAFLGKMKKYIVYKRDAKYQLLMAFLELYDYPNKDNEIAFTYLHVSYSAIEYYEEEEKSIKKDFDKLVEEYNTKTKDSGEDHKVMIKIKEYLENTKVSSHKYNEVVTNMNLSPTFADLIEIKRWHLFFKKESNAELESVNKLLDECIDYFKTNILEYYNPNK